MVWFIGHAVQAELTVVRYHRHFCMMIVCLHCVNTQCYFLERFMAQLLFELPSPSLLLTFVQAPRDLLEESRNSR
eukprot:18999-Heterococcus_DN1.PRE.3